MVWPFHLTMFYPYPMEPDPCYVGGSALLLLEITCLVVVGAYFGRRYLAVGWFWFVGTLIPVIGIVQVGDQSMADRYAYFTFTGLFILVVWLATELLGRWLLGRLALAVAAVGVLAGCMYLTVIQVGYWQGTIVALEHTLREEPDNPAAENNLGVEMWQRAEGTYGERPKTPSEIQGYRNRAIQHWREAVRIRPRFSDAWNNLGCAMRHREEGIDDAAYNKRLEEAVVDFLQAIRYKAEHSDAHSNLAMTLWQLAGAKEKNGGVKDREEVARLKKGAIEHYEETLRLKWDHFDARIGYAQILGEMAMDAKKKGHTAEAEQRFEQAMKHLNVVVHYDEQNARAFDLLGRIEEMQGKRAESTRDVQRAAWLFATNPRAAGRNGQAAFILANKLIQDSGLQDAKNFDILAAALAEMQKYPEAVAAAGHALELATKQGDAKLAEDIRAHLEKYNNKQPFRDERPAAAVKNNGG
jgi:tetratricopeptide (TPR) repeat protein